MIINSKYRLYLMQLMICTLNSINGKWGTHLRLLISMRDTNVHMARFLDLSSFKELK